MLIVVKERLRPLATFFTLSWPERRNAAEAMLCLAAARLLLFLPFRWVLRVIGRPQADLGCLPGEPKRDHGRSAYAVRRAILRVVGRLPWQSNCLVRAIAARMMLRRRHIPSILEVGVRTGTETEFAAHAWLKCGKINVIGVEDAAGFSPMAGFQA
jgi:Transglutaminase-like superfamily